MAAGRIPSEVTTRRATKACKLKMSAPWKIRLETERIPVAPPFAMLTSPGIETTFYELPSSVLYSLLSEAAAKASMATELRVRGLLARMPLTIYVEIE
jgi:hypothetical protein